MAEEMCIPDRKAWHAWLKKNHGTKKEVWLIYYKKRTAMPSIAYDDSVEEALCFGWVDSIIRKIDDEKFARKFTPRKGRSVWSDANKKRAEKMIGEGKMTEAGLARIREAKDCGSWFKTSASAPYKKSSVIPSYLEDGLAANKKAWDNFNRLAESYKRNYVGWIDSAKREETRKRRLAEAITLLERNQKLGMR